MKEKRKQRQEKREMKSSTLGSQVIIGKCEHTITTGGVAASKRES